jgi:hypothetical protein
MSTPTTATTEQYTLPTIDEPITVTQHFSNHALLFLYSKRRSAELNLDDGQRTNIEILNNKKKNAGTSYTIKVVYSLKKPALGFGRFQGSAGSLEMMEKTCRGTLCKDFYHDFDIVNCHPILCVQFARRYFGVDMRNLQFYIENRETILASFSSRNEGKDAMIRMMYGGKAPNSSFEPFVTEIHNFAESLMRLPIFAELLEYSRNKVKNEPKQKNGKQYSRNLVGVFLSLILQTEERRCAMAMMDNARKQGFEPDVYSYDGCQVRRVEGKAVDCAQMEKAVYDATGYVISILEKPMKFHELPPQEDERVPGVLETDYQNMKTLFEENHFYYAPSNTFAEIRDNGSILWMEKKHALEYLGIHWFFTIDIDKGHTVDFFKLWLQDKTRKVIHKIDMKPSLDPFVYSPPLIWAFKKSTIEVTDDRRTLLIKMFNDFLIALLPSELIRNTLIEWIAQIIQEPFKNPLISFILTGAKGCCKDTLGDFLCDFVFGFLYSHNYTSTEQFWDKHDTARVNKFFVKLEEAQGSLNIAHSSDMKARVTAKDMSVNPKNIGATTHANYIRYFMTTNDSNPVDNSDDERRFVIGACGNSLRNKTEFWTMFRSMFFNEEGGKVIGEWLETVPIGVWPRDPPKSEIASMMIEITEGSELKFVKSWDGTETTMEDLFVNYQVFCIDRKLPYAKNTKSFGMRLLSLVRDGVIIRNRRRDGSTYSKPIKPTQ